MHHNTTDQEFLSLAATALAEVAAAAAAMAAPYLRGVARSAPEVGLKRDFHDPVTVHDKRVETEIRKVLESCVPGSRVLGEEMGEGPAPTAETAPLRAGEGGAGFGAIALTQEVTQAVMGLGQRVRWIVDPIDGTANFASGLTYFGTSIGVELDGEIVAGVVSVPFNRELFVADSSSAWREDEVTGERTPLRSQGPKTEKEALLATYYPSVYALNNSPADALAREKALMNAYGTVRRPGAGALDLAMVAAGWIGVSMGVTFKPWDVAAGIHLVRMAGGEVLNLAMGTDEPDGLRPGVVASVGTLHASTARAVLKQVEKAGRE